MNITNIRDLPNLDDIENSYQGAQYIPEEHVTKMQKFIRPEFEMNPYSGMVADNGYLGGTPIQMLNQEQSVNMQSAQAQPAQVQPQSPLTFSRNIDEPTCLEFANHFEKCPICSKFYKNDKSLYIITIGVLALLCLILLKKIIEG